MAITMFMAPLFGQGKNKNLLTEEEIIACSSRIENDWRFGSPVVMWLEDEQTFNRYFETVPLRCPEELEEVLHWSEGSYNENLLILRLEKQIYGKPGNKKCEANLTRYFKDPEKAKAKFAKAHINAAMYEKMAKEFPAIIEGMRNRKYDIPQGDLVNFAFHMGGGMVRRPASRVELARQKDGSYIVLLDTEDFDRFDTLAVTKAQVDDIRKLLIDGEVYKMPRFYDSPVMLLDGPSSHVFVEFTDGSYSCSSYPPSDWGGKNIGEVCKYLYGLRAKN